MAEFSSLYPLIAPEVLGCPGIVMDSAILRASIEFCERSTAWRQPLQPLTLADGVAEYPLIFPDGARLVVIRQGEVKLGNVALLPIKDPSLIFSQSGTPTRYAQRGFDSLILWPTPAGVSGRQVTVFAVLAPKLSAATIPDVLADRYCEAVAEGAKAILKRMPNQPWGDPASAADHRQAFINKAAEARIEQENGLVAGSLTVKPRRFGG